jgi:hypothetical protein
VRDAKRRPRGMSVEVYDPWDEQLIIRYEQVSRWDTRRAGRGWYSRHVRRIAVNAQRIGRPDGTPLGVRDLRTHTTLIW